jgi:F0F1-type ATP synthase assembly protein I
MDDDGKKQKGGGVFGSLVQAESMIQLALALPAGCLIGWFVGMLLDHHFHTEWIQIVGILVGAVAGFVQIFTTASKFMKKGS